MSEGTLFLGVQMHLMSFYDSSSKVANLFSHFEKSDSPLRFYDFFRDDRAGGDHRETDISATRLYGINDLNEAFYIEHLSSNSLILKGSKLRIKLRKL